ncbi:MAG: ribonuclease HII [Muribaculaceae bacterium]|nr:ribonuclease HII [Muribaculaceae bacterium]MDE5924788.1 ribonuclease HII [Muribaculaceae bacterium]MDE6330905.1 ribonuclease HII [Muribaculaceae bacterium]
MLRPYMKKGLVEAGCDEAGRGCLCGPVACAAVILPPEFDCPELNDSKQLSEAQRDNLRVWIEDEALAWSVVMVGPEEIDRINILRASIAGMQRALDRLKWLRIIPSCYDNLAEIPAGEKAVPEHILVDGNKFSNYKGIPYTTVVHGDATYASIAAASILAKTYRDALMRRLAEEYPDYGWEQNMGYPTRQHREAIIRLGITPHHRRSYKPCQPTLFDDLF